MQARMGWVLGASAHVRMQELMNMHTHARPQTHVQPCCIPSHAHAHPYFRTRFLTHTFDTSQQALQCSACGVLPFLHAHVRERPLTCVCMLTYAHAHIHTCPHTHVTCAYVHTHAHIHTCPHTHMPTYTHAHMPTCPHAHMPTCPHTHIHTYAQAHIHTCPHTHMPTYTHAHMPTYTHSGGTCQQALPCSASGRPPSPPYSFCTRWQRCCLPQRWTSLVCTQCWSRCPRRCALWLPRTACPSCARCGAAPVCALLCA